MASQSTSRSTRTSSKKLVPTVIRAATDLLENKGVQAVTIRAVAAQAHVSPASIYNHFGSKQGILDAIAEKHFLVMVSRLREIAEQDPKFRLRQAGIVVRQLMLATPQAYELMWATRPGPAAHDAFTQLIHIVQYGQVAGVFIKDNPRKLAEAIWASVQGAIFIEWQHQSSARDSSDHVTTLDDDAYNILLDVVIRGISRH